jgi:hypothetical protein
MHLRATRCRRHSDVLPRGHSKWEETLQSFPWHSRSNLDILQAVCLWRRALYCWLILWNCDRNSCTLLVVKWICKTKISRYYQHYIAQNVWRYEHSYTCAHVCTPPSVYRTSSCPHADHILPALSTKCNRQHKQKYAFFARHLALPCHRLSPHAVKLKLKPLSVPVRLWTGLEIGSLIEPAVQSDRQSTATVAHGWTVTGYRTHCYRICSTFLSTFARFALASGWESERIRLNNAYMFQSVYCYVIENKAR